METLVRTGLGLHGSWATVWCATGKMAPSEMHELFGVTVNCPIDVVVLKREYVVNQRGEGPSTRKTSATGRTTGKSV